MGTSLTLSNDKAGLAVRNIQAGEPSIQAVEPSIKKDRPNNGAVPTALLKSVIAALDAQETSTPPSLGTQVSFTDGIRKLEERTPQLTQLITHSLRTGGDEGRKIVDHVLEQLKETGEQLKQAQKQWEKAHATAVIAALDKAATPSSGPSSLDKAATPSSGPSSLYPGLGQDKWGALIGLLLRAIQAAKVAASTNQGKVGNLQLQQAMVQARSIEEAAADTFAGKVAASTAELTSTILSAGKQLKGADIRQKSINVNLTSKQKLGQELTLLKSEPITTAETATRIAQLENQINDFDHNHLVATEVSGHHDRHGEAIQGIGRAAAPLAATGGDMAAAQQEAAKAKAAQAQEVFGSLTGQEAAEADRLMKVIADLLGQYQQATNADLSASSALSNPRA